MDSRNTGSLLLTTAAIALATGAAPAAPSEPTWTMIKPSNTGIPGDFVHVIYLDEQDRPWIPAYIPFWEEGGMAHMNEDGTWTTISNVDYPVIKSPRFNDIVRDADGIMWIASDYGLLRFDPEVGPESLVRYDSDNTPLPLEQLWDLESCATDGGYEVWIGTAGEAIAVVTVTTAVTGDLDGDGKVDFADLLILLANWGSCPPPPAECPADLDGGGRSASPTC